MMAAFMIWVFLGGIMVVYGICAFRSKKAVPFSFWANAEMFKVNNVRAYNRAVGKLWCAFGVVFVLLGLPLLGGQNSPYFIISILGCMAETVAAMILYVTVIEKKYRVR